MKKKTNTNCGMTTSQYNTFMEIYKSLGAQAAKRYAVSLNIGYISDDTNKMNFEDFPASSTNPFTSENQKEHFENN